MMHLLCKISRSRSTLLVLELVLLFCHVEHLGGENVLGQEDGEFDFDGLPGAVHEFKVFIHASTEDCFFQPVAAGAKFYVNFEVLKGETQIDFTIRDQRWEVVENQVYKKAGQYSMEKSPGGTYAVCFDNPYARFGGALVYFYMVTFVWQDWLAFQQELGQVQVIAANFSTSLTNVQESVAEMRQSQTKARFNVVKDWYLVHNNNKYVYWWSLAQCILIVVAAVTQVFSVRRLFRTTLVTPTTSKPRA